MRNFASTLALAAINFQARAQLPEDCFLLSNHRKGSGVYMSNLPQLESSYDPAMRVNELVGFRDAAGEGHTTGIQLKFENNTS